MKLYLDTADSQKIIIGLDDKRWTFASQRQKSQELLGLIDKILKKNHVSLKKITAIEVNPGPGSFTGLRIGVAVANSLAWALKVPVNNQKKGQGVEPRYE